MPTNKRGNRTKGPKPSRQSRPHPYPSPYYQPHPMAPFNPYPMFGGMMPQPMAQYGFPMMYPPFMPSMPMLYPYAAPTTQPVQLTTPSSATSPPLQGGLLVAPVPLEPPVVPSVVAPVRLEHPVPAAPASATQAPQRIAAASTSLFELPVERGVPDEDSELIADTSDENDDEETVFVDGTSSNQSGIYLPGVNKPEDLDVFMPDVKKKSQEGAGIGRKKGALNIATKSNLQSSALIQKQTKSRQSHPEDEMAATKRILAELEQVPQDMMASEEDMKRLKHEAESILKIVKTVKCRNHLRSIAYGESPSERHNEYLQSGMLMSGQGPFSLFDDLRFDLLETLDKHCSKHNPTYQFSVLLPEAIIYGAKIHFALSRTKAIEYFESSSKIIASASSD